MMVKRSRPVLYLSASGTKFHPGDNVMRGGDDSLFATADGTVVFHERMNRKWISVKPVNS